VLLLASPSEEVEGDKHDIHTMREKLTVAGQSL
jgi:hypothetical protein